MSRKKKLKQLFSEKDATFILDNYLTMGYKDLADILNVNRHNIVYFLKREGLEGNKKKPRLSENDFNFIKENYSSMTKYQLAEKFNVNVSMIGWAIRELGLNGSKRKNTKPFKPTPKKEHFIRENYKTMTYLDIAKELNTTKGKINYFIRKNGLSKDRLWNSTNKEYLKNNYLKYTDKELAEKTNRTESAIYAKRLELNLIKESDIIKKNVLNKSNKPNKGDDKKSGKSWSEKEKIYLAQNYNSLSDIELGNYLKRSPKAIKHMRCKLHLFREQSRSNYEIEIENFLINHNVKFESQFNAMGYSFDFKIGNTLIEFNGDYYHCNPSIYPNGPINYLQQYTLIKDSEKIESVKNSDYNLIVIWENDYIKNKNNILNKLLAVS